MDYKNQVIIDDSADCLPTKNYKPFENGSNYEIISLPKTIGSFCGGIILAKRTNFFNFCKAKQLKGKVLGFNQSMRKYRSSFIDKNNFDWRFYESHNTYIDYNSAQNIFNCLSNFELNKNVILNRRKKINRYFR